MKSSIHGTTTSLLVGMLNIWITTSGCQEANRFESAPMSGASPKDDRVLSCSASGRQLPVDPQLTSHTASGAPVSGAVLSEKTEAASDETIWPWQANAFYAIGTRVLFAGKVYEAREFHSSPTSPPSDSTRWSEKKPILSCAGQPNGTLCWEPRAVGGRGLYMYYPGVCGASTCIGPELDPTAEAFVRDAVRSSETPRNFNISVNAAAGIIRTTWMELGYEMFLNVQFDGQGNEAAAFGTGNTAMVYVSRSPSGAIALAGGFHEILQHRSPAEAAHLLGSLYRLEKDPAFEAALGQLAIVVEGSLNDICAGKCSTGKFGGLAVVVVSFFACGSKLAVVHPAVGAAAGLACGIGAWHLQETVEDACELDCKECWQHASSCCMSSSCQVEPLCGRFISGCKERKPIITTTRVF